MADSNSRLTRWAGTKARFTEINGQKLDTIITGHLTQEQIDAYQQFFRVEEISEILRKSTGPGKSILHNLPSYNMANFQRDPQPAPQYDQHGNRTNTREAQVRELLEKERHTLVEKAVTSIHNYDPPVDYKKPAKTSEKLYIPIKDYPDINFVGLLLGPRGNTLRQLQDDSGAKLAIRGKGSVKDGKLSDLSGARGPEDDLHVLITADTSAKISKAIKLTNEVIEKAISSPVGQNDLKRDQLRELAVLNGTLRETKPYVPPEIFNQRKQPGRDVTQIICRICGNVGHYSRDCKFKNERPNRPDINERDVDSYSPNRGGSSYVPKTEEELPPWKRQKTDLWNHPSYGINGGAPPTGMHPPPGFVAPGYPATFAGQSSGSNYALGSEYPGVNPLVPPLAPPPSTHGLPPGISHPPPPPRGFAPPPPIPQNPPPSVSIPAPPPPIPQNPPPSMSIPAPPLVVPAPSHTIPAPPPSKPVAPPAPPGSIPPPPPAASQPPPPPNSTKLAPPTNPTKPPPPQN